MLKTSPVSYEFGQYATWRKLRPPTLKQLDYYWQLANNHLKGKKEPLFDSVQAVYT